MMKVQLLLLLALASPLCAVPVSNPTDTYTGEDTSVDVSTVPLAQATTGSTQDPSTLVITGPTTTPPRSAAGVVGGAYTSAAPETPVPATKTPVPATTNLLPVTPATASAATASVPETKTPVVVIAATASAATASVPETKMPVVVTAATASVAPDVVTAPRAKGHETTTQPAGTEVTAEATKAMITGENDEFVGSDQEHDPSTGKVIGIVIGALVSVAIIVAVVIAFLRRMGKYSP